MGCAWSSNNNHRVAPDKAPIARVSTTEASGAPPVQSVENTSICCFGSTPTDDRERLTTSTREEVDVAESDNVCCGAAPLPIPPVPRKRPLTFREVEIYEFTPPEVVEVAPQIKDNTASCFADNSFSFDNKQGTSIKECLEGNAGTLDDAFDLFDDDDRQKFNQQIETARQNCNRSHTYGLKTDESAALYLYSMRDPEDKIYERLQSTLKGDDQSKINKWIKYLRLLRCAWEKLPVISNEVWQGLPYDEEIVENLLSSSSSELFTCIGSCTPLPKVVQSDVKKLHDYKDQIILFGYEGVGAKDITSYIEGNHREVMLWPGKPINQVRLEEKTIDDARVVTAHLSCKSMEIFHVS